MSTSKPTSTSQPTCYSEAFVFDDPRGEADEAVAAFLTDTPAPAQSLLNCFRSLKAQLFNVRQKYDYEHSFTPRRS
jgi:hypothetical protein